MGSTSLKTDLLATHAMPSGTIQLATGCGPEAAGKSPRSETTNKGSYEPCESPDSGFTSSPAPPSSHHSSSSSSSLPTSSSESRSMSKTSRESLRVVINRRTGTCTRLAGPTARMSQTADKMKRKASPEHATTAPLPDGANLPPTATTAMQTAKRAKHDTEAIARMMSVATQTASSPSGSEVSPIASSSFNRRYYVKKMIGKGGNGTVYAGYRRSDGLPVAVKVIHSHKTKRQARMDGRIVPLEFALHMIASRDNPYVIEMLEWFEESDHYVMVMQRHPEMIDLFELCHVVRRPISECDARTIFAQIVAGVRICHRNGIAHRDLKDENVMIDPRTLRIKIIDFGCATPIVNGGFYEHFCGTTEFYPPEWFEHRRYTALGLDSWSLGVILYCLIEGDVPFKRPYNRRRDGPLRRISFRRPQRVTDACLDFIGGVLKHDPQGRITLENMEEHEWLRM